MFSLSYYLSSESKLNTKDKELNTSLNNQSKN